MAITTTTAIMLGVAAAATAGATAYSAHEQNKAAKAAADAQRDVAMAEIEAAKESETLAAETATAKLKAARAKQTQTILTSPLGVDDTSNVNVSQTIGV